ncbi:hypothetical protein [Lacticaseibacillus salsurivasis]|uniref:hypothetical protein n=1 Tax=Lacticaseibacillus salsurivasis TaxID=3081441 RepID=UPI0030C73E99
MLNGIKGKINDKIDEFRQYREEQSRKQQERAEAEAQAERERIRREKEALLALTDKELMVEAIMALRGYNERIADIEAIQDELHSRVNAVESDIFSVEADVRALKSGDSYN